MAYLKALQDGYELESDDPHIKKREMYRYLTDYPQYRTVEHLKSSTSPNIIIK